MHKKHDCKLLNMIMYFYSYAYYLYIFNTHSLKVKIRRRENKEPIKKKQESSIKTNPRFNHNSTNFSVFFEPSM